MDMGPLILILTPILLPVATQLGMEPVQFGAMLILNLAIGLCTPPVARRCSQAAPSAASRSSTPLRPACRSMHDDSGADARNLHSADLHVRAASDDRHGQLIRFIWHRPYYPRFVFQSGNFLQATYLTSTFSSFPYKGRSFGSAITPERLRAKRSVRLLQIEGSVSAAPSAETVS